MTRMQLFTEENVQAQYKMKDAISDLEQSFQQANNIKTAQRTVIPTGEGSKSMLYMPCVDLSLQLGIIKITSITPDNPKHQLPTTQAQIVITDLNTGEHVAVIDGSYLTRLRTGALSAIATKYLSNEDAHVLGMIGTGGMAYEQFLGNMEVRPIDKVLLYNRTTSKAEQFKQRIQQDFKHLDIEVVNDVKDLTAQSDIINCQTPATSPVFSADDIQPGTHINGIGAYQPSMVEIDPKVFTLASYVAVDDLEGVKEESGELIQADNQGIFTFNQIDAELKTLSKHRQNVRQNSQDITIFKCVGAAPFDLACAIGAYQKLK